MNDSSRGDARENSDQDIQILVPGPEKIGKDVLPLISETLYLKQKSLLIRS